MLAERVLQGRQLRPLGRRETRLSQRASREAGARVIGTARQGRHRGPVGQLARPEGVNARAARQLVVKVVVGRGARIGALCRRFQVHVAAGEQVVLARMLQVLRRCLVGGEVATRVVSLVGLQLSLLLAWMLVAAVTVMLKVVVVADVVLRLRLRLRLLEAVVVLVLLLVLRLLVLVVLLLVRLEHVRGRQGGRRTQRMLLSCGTCVVACWLRLLAGSKLVHLGAREGVVLVLLVLRLGMRVAGQRMRLVEL